MKTAVPRSRDWMKSQGHEVFCVFTQWRSADDDAILSKAYSENWILVTNDKDFGEKIYREGRPHHGVILLRLDDERSPIQIQALQSLLENYSDRLADQYIVLTESRVRFARP